MKPRSSYSAAWGELGSGLIYAAFGQRGETAGISLHVVLYGDAAERIGEASDLWNKRLVEMFPPATGATANTESEPSC